MVDQGDLNPSVTIKIQPVVSLKNACTINIYQQTPNTDIKLVKSEKKKGKPMQKCTTKKKGLAEKKGEAKCPKNKPFDSKKPCSFVEKRGDMKSLNEHINSVHGTVYSQTGLLHGGCLFICLKCGYENTRKGQIINHLESNHGNKKYTCSPCGYQTPRTFDLLRHCRKKHEETINTDVANKKESPLKVSNLIKHIQLNYDTVDGESVPYTTLDEGDKQHKCKACDYTTQRIDVMMRHHERKHLDLFSSFVIRGQQITFQSLVDPNVEADELFQNMEFLSDKEGHVVRETKENLSTTQAVQHLLELFNDTVEVVTTNQQESLTETINSVQVVPEPLILDVEDGEECFEKNYTVEKKVSKEVTIVKSSPPHVIDNTESYYVSILAKELMEFHTSVLCVLLPTNLEPR